MSLQRTSHRHEAIAEWLVMNPDRPLGDCAKFFNYTQAWLSQIVHSDLFQVYYRQVCDDRKEIGVHTIANKMSYAAGLALDKTIERLENKPSERFILETADGFLQKLGYGTKGDLHIHNDQHIHLTADQLNAARTRAQELLKVDEPAS